jgi:hypothetical protein
MVFCYKHSGRLPACSEVVHGAESNGHYSTGQADDVVGHGEVRSRQGDKQRLRVDTHKPSLAPFVLQATNTGSLVFNTLGVTFSVHFIPF